MSAATLIAQCRASLDKGNAHDIDKHFRLILDALSSVLDGSIQVTGDIDFNGSAATNLSYVGQSGVEATTGFVRLANAAGIVWRNGANDGNVEGMRVTATNELALDVLGASAQVRVYSAGEIALRPSGSGTDVIEATDTDFNLNGVNLNNFNFLDSTTSTELTIATGAVTATQTFHSVDTESDAATDDLDTINGHSIGRLLFLRPAANGRTVVFKDGTGNLALAGDFSANTVQDTLVLFGVSGTTWLELSRSNNL